MPAVTAPSSESIPTIRTIGFIRRSPLLRISIRISVHDQAQGHRRGSLARLSSHCKGHGRTRDIGYPAVAETIAVSQDVPNAVRSLDEGEPPVGPRTMPTNLAAAMLMPLPSPASD